MCHRPCSSIGFRALVYGTKRLRVRTCRGHSEQEATRYLSSASCSSCVGSLTAESRSPKPWDAGSRPARRAKTVLLWLLSHSRIQSNQAADTVPMVLGGFSKFSLFPFPEPSSINAPLAELVDALGPNPSSLRSEGFDSLMGHRAVNNMFPVAGHDIHGISASSSYPVFFSSSIHWLDTVAGHRFLGIVGRKKTIPHTLPHDRHSILPLSGMLRLMSANEGRPW